MQVSDIAANVPRQAKTEQTVIAPNYSDLYFYSPDTLKTREQDFEDDLNAAYAEILEQELTFNEAIRSAQTILANKAHALKDFRPKDIEDTTAGDYMKLYWKLDNLLKEFNLL